MEQIIKGNVKLISNLICSSDGLIVGDGNTQIDLNGYSIIGPGKNSSKVGIMIGGHDNVIYWAMVQFLDFNQVYMHLEVKYSN